ncbi:zinc finger protein 345-like isoform X1 [Diabrotica virgifera virgifera]|uniref:Zinc finger protein 345-like isoform X1 n=1 Tax=Diabrotica virgifera virgifera TaxID=50390 RepID=A0A6P7GKE3_DIAVI|nr:zinc finger protein 345-like isoform X1 [Diabrotica virgifera virgifera]
MEVLTLLSDSNFCRLCAENNEHGIHLFTPDESNSNLQQLINKYLPIEVEIDNKFPKYICPGCHIQLESTKLFLDLIVEGQAKLREMYKKQQEILQKQPLDIFSSISYPLYAVDNALRLQAEGLERPKRKRGRPAKKSIPEEELSNQEIEIRNEEKEEEVEEVGPDGRRKRKIRAPARYQGVVQGKELDDILKKEGVIDEGNTSVETILKVDQPKFNINDLIIGRTEGECGEDLDTPVFLNKSRSKRKAITYKELEMGVYKCDICSKRFINKMYLDLHVETHENEDLNAVQPETILEDPCNTIVESIEQVTLEFNAIETAGKQIEEFSLDNNNLQVPDENKPVCNKDILELHLTECNKTKNYTCNICAKVLHHPSSLLYHKETEHNNKRFVCIICDKRFRHRTLLQKHQVVHSDKRPYICQICNSAFKSVSYLVNHQKIHSGEKKYECTECGQKFAHKTSLAVHQRGHEGIKPYECEFCHKTFSQSGNLLEHKRIHTGEKPYCCEVCGKNFTTSSQMRMHMKIHTGEKPWVCATCGKRFLHKDSYTFHVRRHHNEEPHKCEVCSRTFITPWAAKKHMRSHTGEKPYKCEFCHKTFADRSNKDRHFKIHNKDQQGLVNTLQLSQLLDEQGNPLKITQDGHTVSIVTSGGDDSNLHGMLPDGRLIPIEITSAPEKDFDLEMDQSPTEGLLEPNSSDAMILQDVLDEDIVPSLQVLTDSQGQQVCVITYSIKEESE